MSTIFPHQLVLDQANGAIGTHILDLPEVLTQIREALSDYTFPTSGPYAGKGMIPLPNALEIVQPGVGPRELLTEDTLVLREHRGMEGAYLDRTKVPVGETQKVHAIVYTNSAFDKDPETTEEDRAQVAKAGASHVLITCLATGSLDGEGRPPLSPKRFLLNVAGANDSYDPRHNKITLGMVAAAKTAATLAETEDPRTPLLEGASWAFLNRLYDMALYNPGSYHGSKALAAHPDLLKEVEEIMDYWETRVVLG
jgi:hypothetical protein